MLPFTLTDAQERAIAEIDVDLARTTPMQRLLQGDVGSGKTVVALATLLRAVEAGRQGALMAPTEVLAEQHFLTIEGICTELGVRVALLTSALTAKEHANVRQLIASGDVQIAVGTHALIQKEVGFRDLAVAVVDEQHRFGVEQRSALAEGRSPHVLHMTATPIPAHARADRLRRPAGLRDHRAARQPQADRDRLGHRRPQLRGVRAADAAPHGRAPGLRRLPADRGVRDDGRARGRGRGRAAAPGRAEGFHASAACTAASSPPSAARSWRRSRRARSTCSSRRR